jgi:hypothetical protein
LTGLPPDDAQPQAHVVGFVGFAGPEASSADLESTLGLGLTDALSTHGLRAVPITELKDQPAALLSFNHHDEALDAARRWGMMSRQLVLALFEPPAVRPDQHKRALWRRYGLVVAPSLSWAASSGGAFLPWPQNLDRVRRLHKDDSRGRRSALLNANKWSATGDSLYGLRRQVIHRAQKQGLDLDVYGVGWDRGTIQNIPFAVGAAAVALRSYRLPVLQELVRGIAGSANWKGVAADKAATLSAYQLSVVIENSATYLSEKLFDALTAGTVPVYVGPSLEAYGIPKDVAVQVTPRAGTVLDAVRDLDMRTIRQVREAGRDFMSDPTTRGRWSIRAVMDELARLVAECAVVRPTYGEAP